MLLTLRNMKEALKHGLKTKKRFIKQLLFYQEAWRKPYIDMSTESRKNAKMILKKAFNKLMNNAVFGKTMEKCKKAQIY